MKLNDKIYAILKYGLTIFVPALISLIIGLGKIYGFETDVIVQTIALVSTFLGAVFGISCAVYSKTENEVHG